MFEKKYNFEMSTTNNWIPNGPGVECKSSDQTFYRKENNPFEGSQDLF